MADRLYLSIWFPSFQEQEMLPRLLSVLKQFPFSADRPGIGYLAFAASPGTSPSSFEQTFDDRATPEQALRWPLSFCMKTMLMRSDVLWDLWVPTKEGDLDETWVLKPQTVKFIAFGTEFEEAPFRKMATFRSTSAWTLHFSLRKPTSPAFWSSGSRPTSISWSASPARWRKTAASADACCGQNQRTTSRKS